jgi:hypothetical protein
MHRIHLLQRRGCPFDTKCTSLTDLSYSNNTNGLDQIGAETRTRIPDVPFIKHLLQFWATIVLVQIILYILVPFFYIDQI